MKHIYSILGLQCLIEQFSKKGCIWLFYEWRDFVAMFRPLFLMIKAKCKESSCCSSLILLCQFNAQVAIGGSVPKKPGDCNRNHIPKALGPPKEPVTLRPDSIAQWREKKKMGEIGR